VLGDRRIVVCRELTKLYEEIFRGSAAEALDHFEKPRGEFTLVIEGSDETQPKQQVGLDVDAELSSLRDQGLRARDAVRSVSERAGLPHREVYNRWLALPKQD
jgi:16S rRNA (cytidine1402-2'-O)-methyltransferase